MAVFIVEWNYAVDRAGREPVNAEHKAHLSDLADRGILVAGGPLPQDNAGLLIYRVQDRAALAEVLGADPYVRAGYVKHSSIREWQVNFGVLA
ncbi:YciI family protein [Gordonia sp. CPCC 205333]|uniref:YciI family protein n=1 Tax=Gordonia sp. CPCC 205333 TaxID=3140790 RepID=UPI003AF3EAE0